MVSFPCDLFSTLNVCKCWDLIISNILDRRVILLPRGNDSDYLSIYLDVANSTSLPHGWSVSASSRLSVVNQINSKITIQHGTKTSSLNFYNRSNVRFVPQAKYSLNFLTLYCGIFY